VNADDQRRRRTRVAILVELACLLLFLVAVVGIVVVIVIGWPWPLFAVLGVFLARASVEGVLRPDTEQLDEPS
jgi:hypothetical protein